MFDETLYRLFGRSAVSHSGPGEYTVQARLQKDWTSKHFAAYAPGFRSLPDERSCIQLGGCGYVFLAKVNEPTP